MRNIHILLIIATLFLTGCVSPEAKKQNVSELIYLAGQKHDAGKYKESIKLLNKAIKLDSENILAYTNRAASKTKLNDIDGAIIDCEKVVVLDPQNMFAHFNLAQHYETKKDYEKAIDHYTCAEMANHSANKIRLIVTYPNEPNVDYSIAIGKICYYRAMAYIKSEKYDEAIMDLNYCVSIDYYLDHCYFRLGECYQKLDNPKEACRHLLLSKEMGFAQADSLLLNYCN